MSVSDVLYLDGSVVAEPVPGGVLLGDVAVASPDPSVLYRVAACLMVAAHELTNKLDQSAASDSGRGVAVSR